MSFAVRDFFLNGGGQALIVRLATSDASPSTIDVGGPAPGRRQPGRLVRPTCSVTISAGQHGPGVPRHYGVSPPTCST